MEIRPLLTTEQFARIIGRSKSAVEQDRSRGVGCPFVRIGRKVRYRPEDVERYLGGLPTLHSTADERDAGNSKK